VTRGVAAAVAPVGSAVRMSTAYLNINGTYSKKNFSVRSSHDGFLL